MERLFNIEQTLSLGLYNNLSEKLQQAYTLLLEGVSLMEGSKDIVFCTDELLILYKAMR